MGGQQITGEPAELQPVLRGSLIGVQSTPRQILKAMICSPSRRFSFATMQALATNIKIRDGVLTSMRRVMSGQIPLTFARSLEGLQMPAGTWKKSTANPYGGIVITKLRGGVAVSQESWTWESLPPIDAHQAIESILTQPSTLECLTGVQVIVLLGVEQAIGAADFDAMHPRRGPGGSALWGIGVPLLFHGDPSVVTPRISSARSHLILVRYRTLDQGAPHAAPVDTDNDPRTGPIAQADMVPGDYVYVNSISDYDVVHQGGSWNGENAVYMGPDSFYGLGLGTSFQTESELKSDIANHYNTDQFVNKGWFWRPANPSEILWTLIASPTLNGNPAEAGPFVR